MPPPEVLAAAAAVSAAQREQEEEEEAEDMIGPPPPEVVAEVDLSTADMRTREAARVLEAHAREEDAYEILGVELDADKAAVKKRYWKLSLMVCIPPHLMPRRSDKHLTLEAELRFDEPRPLSATLPCRKQSAVSFCRCIRTSARIPRRRMPSTSSSRRTR